MGESIEKRAHYDEQKTPEIHVSFKTTRRQQSQQLREKRITL